MASHPELELDRQLCFALYTASRAVVRAYGPLLDDAGLTYPQYVTLLALWEDPARSRSVGGLGERLQLDSGTLTPLLKRLASMGYVTRARDTQDERRVLVTLTDEGIALRDRLASVPQSFLHCLGMDPAEAGGLRDQLTALMASLEPRDAVLSDLSISNDYGSFGASGRTKVSVKKKVSMIVA
jgi:MarR family transcriptional regulator, organic hydroperoxide resistance regulator